MARNPFARILKRVSLDGGRSHPQQRPGQSRLREARRGRDALVRTPGTYLPPLRSHCGQRPCFGRQRHQGSQHKTCAFAGISWCRRPGSNRHGALAPPDFESAPRDLATNPATHGGIGRIENCLQSGSLARCLPGSHARFRIVRHHDSLYSARRAAEADTAPRRALGRQSMQYPECQLRRINPPTSA